MRHYSFLRPKKFPVVSMVILSVWAVLWIIANVYLKNTALVIVWSIMLVVYVFTLVVNIKQYRLKKALYMRELLIEQDERENQ